MCVYVRGSGVRCGVCVWVKSSIIVVVMSI